MKILCCTYREWAKAICRKLEDSFKENYCFLYINSKEQYSSKLINELNPDLILWYGWSWIVPKNILDNYYSVMLHPSPLPKYRGGSPIQNQIINGEKNSAVTLFKMNDKMDAGPIIKQKEFSLSGNLDDIFDRIVNTGFELSLDLLKNFPNIQTIDQKGNPTYFTRRFPNESIITIEDIKNNSAKYLHNKIRALQDPYPNAYIKCSDGKKLFITHTKYEK